MEGETLVYILMFLFAGFLILVGALLQNHYSEYPDTFCGYHIEKSP